MKILFVEDDPLDMMAFKRFIKYNKSFKYEVEYSSEFEDAVYKIKNDSFSAVISDLHLSNRKAFDFFEYTDIPLIIVTGGGDEETAVKALKMGASDYIVKDVEGNYFKILEVTVDSALKNRNNEIELKEYKNNLENLVKIKSQQFLLEYSNRKKAENSLSEVQNKLKMAKNALILSMAELTESRDYETGSHIMRIREYCKVLSVMLKNENIFPGEIDDDFIENIHEVSILHDIGKVGIPDAILLKPSKLTPEEFEIIKTHTLIGGNTIKKVLIKYSDFSSMKMAYDITMYHHEKWNGNGYPEGLKGKEIPLCARIVTCADIFDALANKRIYKDAFSLEKVEKIMDEESGVTLDPDIYRVFRNNIEKFINILNSFI